jgi:hypothetical protein
VDALLLSLPSVLGSEGAGVPLMLKAVKAKKDAEIAVTPGNPLVLRGARNVHTLSAAFIADLQRRLGEVWHGHFPDIAGEVP